MTQVTLLASLLPCRLLWATVQRGQEQSESSAQHPSGYGDRGQTWGNKEEKRTERNVSVRLVGTLLNIQLRADQHMHERKQTQAGKERLERIRDCTF